MAFAINDSVIKWFESYLSNRKILVCTAFFFLRGEGGEGGGNIKVLLFLLYVNDIFQSLSEAGSYLYADDTCFLYQQKEV